MLKLICSKFSITTVLNQIEATATPSLGPTEAALTETDTEIEVVEIETWGAEIEVAEIEIAETETGTAATETRIVGIGTDTKINEIKRK